MVKNVLNYVNDSVKYTFDLKKNNCLIGKIIDKKIIKCTLKVFPSGCFLCYHGIARACALRECVQIKIRREYEIFTDALRKGRF